MWQARGAANDVRNALSNLILDYRLSKVGLEPRAEIKTFETNLVP